MPYNSRKTRHQYIVDTYSPLLTGCVLNIGGGGQKHLLSYCTPQHYVELDISGTPDILFDLDSGQPIPFANDSFDSVICTDVLEHLENFHFILSEILRVSRTHVIISLPNSTDQFRNYLFRTKYYRSLHDHRHVSFTKFYGLPLTPPSDRHRWFFSYTEASSFFHHNPLAKLYSISSEDGLIYEPGFTVSNLLRRILSLFIPKPIFLDHFARSYWVCLKKNRS